MGKTNGEQLFERYLTEHGIGWRYEVPTLTSRPDYLLDSEPVIAVEVEDLVDIHPSRTFVGSIDPYKRLRQKIDVGAEQLRPYKAINPCVVILRNVNAVLVPMQDEIVAGAMFGDLGFSVPLNDNGSSARQIFIPRRAKLRANAHTTVSAVGVLEHHAPHAHLLDEYLESQLAANPLGRELSDLLQRSADLASEFVACNPHVNDTVVRVRLIHNPFAAVPMRLPTPFSGPHDVHLWPRLE